MRALLLAACLLWPGRLAAWDEQASVVLLAVPAEDFSQWQALAKALGSAPEPKLTLALTPGMLTAEVREALAPALSTGRLELAMRIPGDPLLALVAGGPAASDLRHVLDPLAVAREKFRAVLSTAPAGFVPAGGAAAQGLASAFQAMGISWVGVGDAQARAEAGAPWLPFTAPRSEEKPPAAAELEAAGQSDPLLPAQPALIVLDEASGLVPRGAMVSSLKEFVDKHPNWRWQTASEYLAENPAVEPAHSQDWPGWGPDPRPATPAAEAAWKAYQDTAAALRRYQNSGTADIKALENAADALYAAQANRYYRILSGTMAGNAAAADRDLRRHLMNVYRRLKVTVPGRLYASFASPQASTGTAAAGEEVSTDLRTEQGPGWLSFQNPFGSLSRGPEKGVSAEPWHILGLRLDWDAASVAFTFHMAAIDVSTRTPSAALGRLVLDAYMDINHVPGAGSPALLEGRGSFAANRDCWEYALSLGPSGGVLLRAIPEGAPAVLAQIPVSADLSRMTIRAVVPRSLLRGNPLRWGYILAAFAAKSAALREEGPAAVRPGGPLGLLAPLEEQQALAAGARLNAVRLPSP
ncbi:MAG: hypothetical protein NTY77_08845 [Elusimicrobia bacterium]|nr:hypothetical protein [Elusimicrobiota bacterium]